MFEVAPDLDISDKNCGRSSSEIAEAVLLTLPATLLFCAIASSLVKNLSAVPRYLSKPAPKVRLELLGSKGVWLEV
jgi:hypothetical protein